MSSVVWLIFLSTWGWTQEAVEPKSCLPKSTALQGMEWVTPHHPKDFLYSLRSTRGEGDSFLTKVQLQGKVTEGEVNMLLRFDPKFDGVSLPYNVYAVLVIVNEETVAWWDFTQGCRAPGLSFFPGSEIGLPKIKLQEPARRLQIMVWGTLF